MNEELLVLTFKGAVNQANRDGGLRGGKEDGIRGGMRLCSFQSCRYGAEKCRPLQ